MSMARMGMQIWQSLFLDQKAQQLFLPLRRNEQDDGHFPRWMSPLTGATASTFSEKTDGAGAIPPLASSTVMQNGNETTPTPDCLPTAHRCRDGQCTCDAAAQRRRDEGHLRSSSKWNAKGGS